ncbi:MAG: site-specific recombinase [Candidatus Angelobacter sp.]|nr:site-specific recombinase [Candidatus Angelobacter sp.]
MAKRKELRQHPKVGLIYLRVSTKEQMENLSMEIQEARCIEWCKARGITVQMVFHDDGKSARTTERPEFQKMLSLIKSRKGQIGYVVVHDLSRFARNLENQVEVLTELGNANVLLRSVAEDVDETAAGKLMRNIHGTFNQFFSDRNAERTKVGMEKSARIGRFPFKAPIGYLNVRATRDSANLIPDPNRAALVKKAFELYSSGTVSRADALRQVTLLGLTTQKSKPLTAQSFENLLRNPVYAGWVVIPAWGLKERGSFEPLLTDEIFERVQDIMDGKRLAVVPNPRNNSDFPLRLFVRCAECSVPLTGSSPKGRTKHYSYYHCRNAKCRAITVAKSAMEDQFLALLHRLTPSREFLALFRDVILVVWKRKQVQAHAQLTAITQRLGIHNDRKNALMDRYLDGKIDQATYEEQSHRLTAEIEIAKKELCDAEENEEQVDGLLEFADRVLRDPAGLWVGASLDQRQRLQKVLFPDGLGYSMNEGFGTGQAPSFFNSLAGLEVTNSSLASPTGFEPVLSP